MGFSLFGVVKYQMFFLPTKIREQIVLKRKWNNLYINEDLLIKMKILIENW
jgi:hypothetical protein